MVIGQLIQQLEPVLSDKIMSLSDLPTVATYVQNLYTNAALVWQSNATLTPESDRLMAGEPSHAYPSCHVMIIAQL